MSDTKAPHTDEKRFDVASGEPSFSEPPPPYYYAPTAVPATAYAQPMLVQPQSVPGIPYATTYVATQQVPDHLMYAVMATICCCWPIGLFAIMKSMECRNAINRGDVNSAVPLSRQARMLSNWAVGVGIAFVIFSFIITGIYIWLTVSQMHH